LDYKLAKAAPMLQQAAAAPTAESRERQGRVLEETPAGEVRPDRLRAILALGAIPPPAVGD